MAAGDKVQLIGFGTFDSRKRSERTGHNPATGEEIKIPAATVPAFKAGKAFKAMVDAAHAAQKPKKGGLKMIQSEEFTREEAIAMGAFREDALELEDVLDDQEIMQLIEMGVDITGYADK